MKQLLLLSLMLIPASGVFAVTTEPLSGEVFVGPATGEVGSGSFTYDETLLTGAGTEELGIADGLELEFTFLGITFFETDDVDFDDFPILILEDGVPTTLDFAVFDGDGVGTEIGDPRLDAFTIVDLVPDPAGGFFAEISTFIVPEPSTLALFGLSLSLVGARFRRFARG